MMKKLHPLFIFILGGVLFFVDRTLKFFAFSHPQLTWYFWRPWLGWEYFENPGVAFGIPLPWFAAFIYTPIILVFVVWYYHKKIKNYPFAKDKIVLLAILFILFGAISNLMDRIQYHITIDYIRIFTSIINLSDIMIVFGAAILFYKEIKTSP